MAGIGLRLRTLRERAGLTLAQTAQATGISTSTLSRLESGTRRATLELLLPLARVFQVTLDELVTLPTVRDPRITPTIHRSAEGAKQVLTRQASSVQIHRMLIRAAPGRSGQEPLQTSTHPGKDWVYVLSGSLRLVLGEQEFVLGPGQAAEFDTTVPHGTGAADHRAVDYLSLFSREGEKAHRAEGPARS